MESDRGGTGFCFGVGGCVYELLCSGASLDAAASFRGIFSSRSELSGEAKDLLETLLILHRNDDPMFSQTL